MCQGAPRGPVGPRVESPFVLQGRDQRCRARVPARGSRPGRRETRRTAGPRATSSEILPGRPANEGRWRRVCHRAAKTSGHWLHRSMLRRCTDNQPCSPETGEPPAIRSEVEAMTPATTTAPTAAPALRRTMLASRSECEAAQGEGECLLCCRSEFRFSRDGFEQLAVAHAPCDHESELASPARYA